MDEVPKRIITSRKEAFAACVVAFGPGFDKKLVRKMNGRYVIKVPLFSDIEPKVAIVEMPEAPKVRGVLNQSFVRVDQVI